MKFNRQVIGGLFGVFVLVVLGVLLGRNISSPDMGNRKVVGEELGGEIWEASPVFWNGSVQVENRRESHALESGSLQRVESPMPPAGSSMGVQEFVKANPPRLAGGALMLEGREPRQKAGSMANRADQPARAGEEFGVVAGSVPLEVEVPFVPGNEVTIPAALANPPEGGGMGSEAESEVEKLAEEFVRRVAGGGYAAEDSAYREAWEDAAVLSDAQFKARYGNQAWMERHIQAHHENRQGEDSNP